MNIGRVNLVAEDHRPDADWSRRRRQLRDVGRSQARLRIGAGRRLRSDAPIGRFEFWAFDVAQRKLLSRTPFDGRPRMALRVSSNGKLLYVYQAGATIDVYERRVVPKLRTIEMNAADQTTTLYILPRK